MSFHLEHSQITHLLRGRDETLSSHSDNILWGKGGILRFEIGAPCYYNFVRCWDKSLASHIFVHLNKEGGDGIKDNFLKRHWWERIFYHHGRHILLPVNDDEGRLGYSVSLEAPMDEGYAIMFMMRMLTERGKESFWDIPDYTMNKWEKDALLWLRCMTYSGDCHGSMMSAKPTIEDWHTGDWVRGFGRVGKNKLKNISSIWDVAFKDIKGGSVAKEFLQVDKNNWGDEFATLKDEEKAVRHYGAILKEKFE